MSLSGAVNIAVCLSVACVVVPPPQSAQQPTQSPATAANGAPYGGIAYGRATYGLNTCAASYGGVTYGGTTCGSWITETMPSNFGNLLTTGTLGVAVMEQASSKPCRVQFGFRDCQPANGADVIVTLPDGAVANGRTNSNGLYIQRGIRAGTYRLRVQYLGNAVEATFTLSAQDAASGQAMAASLSLADRR